MLCPQCHTSLLNDDLYCASCGEKIGSSIIQNGNEVVYIDKVSEKKVLKFDEPHHRFSHTPAPLGRHFIAFFIDLIITGLLLPLVGLGIVYFLLKDGLNNGRSFGKIIMGLRVINCETYQPGKFSDSFGRNFGIFLDFTLFFNNERRHISDMTAGTMVIKDYSSFFRIKN